MSRDGILTTLRQLRAHKLRFALTSSGIVWGVALLTFLSGLLDGYDAHYFGEVEKVGSNMVFVFAGTPLDERVGARGARSIEFERADVAALPTLQSVRAAGANQFLGSRIFRAGRRSKLLWTMGVNENTLVIRNYTAAAGRLFHRSEVTRGDRVAFLGAAAAERLYGRAPAVGSELHIDSIPFRVVGVAEPKGEQLVHVSGRDDELAYVPVTTAHRWLTQQDAMGVLLYEPAVRAESLATQKPVRELLGRRHHFAPDSDTAVAFFDIKEAMGLIAAVGTGLRLFLSVAAAVTLLVGAVGVMNIMLVVVGERRREIGLRKAVGATSRAIFGQFLGETLLLTTLSGALGLLLGYGMVRAAAAAVPREGAFASVPVADAATMGGIAAVLVMVGLLAGVLPALRAARVDPAVSLRAS